MKWRRWRGSSTSTSTTAIIQLTMENTKQFTLAEYAQRDKKESKLGILDAQQSVADDLYEIAKKSFKKQHKLYVQWKKQMGMPGIKY